MRQAAPMTSGLKLYPKMKNSGVPSLGEVPAHWEIRKLRAILRRVTQRNRPDLPLLSVVREKGVIHRDTTDQEENHNFIPDDLSNYKVVRPGQFAMNKMKAWQGSYGVSQCEGIVSPAYFVFDVGAVEGRFFHAAIRSRAYVPSFAQASDGVRIGQWDLAEPRMREIVFGIPPLHEQAAIVRFLDHADRRIRRYIRAKQRLIKLLGEQKQAIIRRAVTRGLDPNVRLKPSGVEWLGDVPEHWEEGRLSQFFTLQRGFDITKEHQRSGSVPVVSSGGVSSYHDIGTDKGPGVLVGRKGTAGAVYYIAGQYWAHDTTLWVNNFKGNYPKFVFYLLSTLDLKRFDTGSANPTINRNLVHPERVAFPPSNEQATIAAKIDADIAHLDRVLSEAERSITLVREYRTRLISDVVTGKLDVRKAAAGLPDEAAESELLDESETVADTEEESAADNIDSEPEEAEA